MHNGTVLPKYFLAASDRNWCNYTYPQIEKQPSKVVVMKEMAFSFSVIYNF